VRLEVTRPFEHDYAHLPTEVRDRVDKQLALLLVNPRHPSLRLKRLQGTDRLWEARISRNYRMTLEMAGDVILLRRLGTHGILK
jgi:mRNA interferase RelE/StbE